MHSARSCREAQKGGAKGRRKGAPARPMVVFYSARLAIAHGAVEPRPRPTRLGMLARWGIGSAGVHDSRAERFLPGPGGPVTFSFPRFAPHRLGRTNLPLCGMFALRRGIYRCPNY